MSSFQHPAELPGDAASSRGVAPFFPIRISAGALLFVALLVLAFAFQGSRGLWETDEGRYAAVALQMLRTGDWMHPALSSLHPHYTKPPMTYWLVGAAVKAFGVNEWALRLPNAVAFCATAFLVGRMAHKLMPRKGMLGGMIYATMLATSLAANILTTDTLLTCFEAMAVLAWIEAWQSTSVGGRWGWLALMGIGFGLAFLTKGPPALIPLAGLLPFAFYERGIRGVGQMLAWPAVLTFGAVGLSWYAIAIVDHPELLGYWLRDEVAGRVMSPASNRNGEWYGPLKIYLPMLLVGGLPWWGVLIASPRCDGAMPARSSEERGVWRLLALWLVIPLAIFIVARSRMYLYLLPLFMPLALLIAWRLPASWLERRSARWTIGLWCGFVLGIKLAMALIANNKDSRAFAAQIPESPEPVGRLVFVAMQPRYGLSLYRGVEAVTAGEATDADLTLSEVMEDRTVGQLMIVRQGAAETDVMSAADEAHRAITTLSHFDDKAVILLAAGK